MNHPFLVVIDRVGDNITLSIDREKEASNRNSFFEAENIFFKTCLGCVIIKEKTDHGAYFVLAEMRLNGAKWG